MPGETYSVVATEGRNQKTDLCNLAGCINRVCKANGRIDADEWIRFGSRTGNGHHASQKTATKNGNFFCCRFAKVGYWRLDKH